MIKTINNIQLTKNFTLDEFANHLPNETVLKLDMQLVESLQKLRDIVGSIEVTSGYRTPNFNKTVGGSSNSYHLDGLAADIKFNFDIWTVNTLFQICRYCGFNNVTIYIDGKGMWKWIHVDVGKPRKGDEYYRTLLV